MHSSAPSLHSSHFLPVFGGSRDQVPCLISDQNPKFKPDFSLYLSTECWICIFQVEKTQRQRFYAAFFNANAEIVKNLNIPKARGAGEFVASYSGFSLNATTGFAEGVVEFDEQVWSNKLEERLAEQGAACITILTFANNDNNQSAGAALARVWKSAKGPGFELVTHGKCNARLLAKAEEITLEDKQKEKEIDKECEEKIQAGLKQSLALQEEIKEKMVTKDDLAEVEKSLATKDDLKTMTKAGFDKMDESLTVKFSQTVINQRQTIVSLQEAAKNLEEIIISKDRDNQQLTGHNDRQRYMLGQLNQEKKDNLETIKTLNERIQSNDKMIIETVNTLNERIQSKDKMIIDIMEKNQALSAGSSSGSSTNETIRTVIQEIFSSGSSTNETIRNVIREIFSDVMQEYTTTEGSRKRKPE